jgi:dolichol-phosphate mannosyltransferase
MLFRLYTIRAVVHDMPMRARYADESSSLRVSRVLLEFPVKYLLCAFKRIFYAYFLRDFNAGSLQLALGVLATAAGATYGAMRWADSISSGVPATSGEVMLAALPLLVGVQLLLGALNFDVQNIPREPLSRHAAPIGGAAVANGLAAPTAIDAAASLGDSVEARQPPEPG